MSPSSGSSGILFVLSAPSGTGKSTLARGLVKRVAGLELSVSYTTRKPREGEIDGKHYHFLEGDRFEEMIEAGEFLEHAGVFGSRYGTGVDATRQLLGQGTDLLLEIDVQGARQVRNGAVPSTSIMVLPPDYETLSSRLGGRGTESDEQRKARLAEARGEAEQYRDFDFVVVNNRLEDALKDLAAIVVAERLRTSRRVAAVQGVLATFPS